MSFLLNPLNNSDIEKILRNKLSHLNFKNFRGVFSKNILPIQVNENEFGVINNDSFGSGTHWVSYYNNSKEKNIEFFDSFGLPPAEEIKNFLLKSNKNIEYNSSQIQDNKSAACGYFCINYILSRNKGICLLDFIDKFDINYLPINEYLLFEV